MLSIYYYLMFILQTDHVCIVLRTAVTMIVATLQGEYIQLLL